MRAGAAQVEITPAQGTQLAGDVGIRRPAESVLDPLYARAVAFEQDGRKLCILGLDVTFIGRAYTERIRAAARGLGYEPDAVFVHATQTHSAPPIGHFLLDDEFPLPPEFQWLRLGEAGYSAFATERAIEAIRRADAALEPVRLGAASAVRSGLAFNRRGVRRDGTVGMPWTWSETMRPLGPTEYRYLEGPDDPEVGVVAVQGQSMRLVAMLLHFTCHPVNVFYYRGRGAHAQVSADWPGSWAAGMRAALGEAGVAVVLNGCCGNINPWPPFEPDFVPDHRRMGAALTATALRVMGALQFQDRAVLDWRRRLVPIPLRELDGQALAEAQALLAAHPEPVRAADDPRRVDWAWYRAAMLASLELQRRREPALPYEVQVLRMGDVALVGLPGEPFVEGQLRLKIASPTYPTYVAHATSHFAGYIPTREALARGGHEVATSSWAFLTPEALDLIVDAAVGLLKDMFKRPSAAC